MPQDRDWSLKRSFALCAAGTVLMVAGIVLRGGGRFWIMAPFPLVAFLVLVVLDRFRR